MTKTDSLANSAYRELFWESIADVPALRFQLVEIVEARSMAELARQWGFAHREQCVRYIKGPLRKRLRKAGGGRAEAFLRQTLAEKGVIDE